MPRDGAEALHPAIAAGLLALMGNGLPDRTDRRLSWPGQVEEIDHGVSPLGAARLWASCLNAGSDYDDDLKACGDLARQAFAQGRITRPQVQFAKGFGDVLAVEDRLQRNKRSVP
jgi:hypothetical protein